MNIKTDRTQLVRIFLLLIFCLAGSSCRKFVDIKRTSTLRIIETTDDCQQILDYYNTMNLNDPSDGEASADNSYLSDAGYNSSSLQSDDRSFYIWDPGAIRATAGTQYQPSYYVIYTANLVLENLDKLKGTAAQQVLDNIRGQALFFRGFRFWGLAQLYAKPYSAATAGQDPGIPIRLGSDINEKSTRGTVQQTYAQIISDLNQAVSLLPATSPSATRPNKAAAYAMLARVYLSMEDYGNALTSATAALQLNNQLMDFNTVSTSSNTPFPRFNKEVIFQAILSRVPALNPGSASSNIAKINPVLYASYASSDLRKTIFFKPNSGANAGTYRFTGNYEPVTSASLFDGLAVDELYLTRAECYARAGNVTAALTDLNTLLRTRWVTGQYVDMTAATADQALAIILTERRKELVMRGQRWTDLRRLNKDSRFAVTQTRTVAGQTYTLPPNDLRYTLLIPNEVIVSSGIAQNPR
ncbi:RagB/SusD family nutrient uptake outer membrane protein [Mucilaginibacter sp. UR6-11]|uniref:RagB/SusD family nutrient uptake outer membrane protein n=1 Tax=Mucilaginibacter sp. UR6-11 TaxID=1435644 RepID=UPI001E50FDAC|nr:RagB/SusD family nutrient uptake outer membrane protein [Mucilaginibacter sp. UR6-11]MCC8423591.1 RagB/SusD family nutrient uptake outer membrane protein [Mucilaginibacter sp. UR6-11]